MGRKRNTRNNLGPRHRSKATSASRIDSRDRLHKTKGSRGSRKPSVTAINSYCGWTPDLEAGSSQSVAVINGPASLKPAKFWAEYVARRRPAVLPTQGSAHHSPDLGAWTVEILTQQAVSDCVSCILCLTKLPRKTAQACASRMGRLCAAVTLQCRFYFCSIIINFPR